MRPARSEASDLGPAPIMRNQKEIDMPYTIKDLEKLLENTTPGPWREFHNDICGIDPHDGDDLVFACVGKSYGQRSGEYTMLSGRRHQVEIKANADIMAASPQVVAELIEAKKEIADLRSGASDIAEDYAKLLEDNLKLKNILTLTRAALEDKPLPKLLLDIEALANAVDEYDEKDMRPADDEPLVLAEVTVTEGGPLKSPYKDFAGVEIFEGDVIEHPDGIRGKVIYDIFGGRKWVVDYGTGEPYSLLSLQIGNKGQAVVDKAARFGGGS